MSRILTRQFVRRLLLLTTGVKAWKVEGNIMRHKLVLWFVLLIAGFLVGFILQYARLQRLQEELSASSKRLVSCQSSEQLTQLRDTATMMYLEAAQKNYGLPASTRRSFSIKRSELSVAQKISHLAIYSVTAWQPAIRSRVT